MAATYAHINPYNLRWARERAQLSEAVLAKKLNIKEDKLTAWEAGLAKLTFKQAQNFAKKTLVPFGYLFLSQPPAMGLPIPDLRTIDNEYSPRPSAELIKMVQIVTLRQQWYREYLQREEGRSANQRIGRFTQASIPSEIVKDIRVTLGIPDHPIRGSWEDYFSSLITAIEKNGILVMRQSNLGSHAQPLSVTEFRGFALFDPVHQ